MNGDYPKVSEANAVGYGGLQRPSLTDRLSVERKTLEDRLEVIKKVQAGLQENPATADLLDLIARLGL